MKNWIPNSYINPNNQSYLFLDNLNKYLKLYLLIITLLILAYPTFNYVNNTIKISHQQKEIIQSNEKLTKSVQLLQSLKQHHSKINQQDKNFSIINQKINEILEKNHTKAENLQWNLDSENKLYLTLNQSSRTIFNILTELNTLENLYLQDLILAKLHQQRLVQLNATFILTY